MVNTQVIIVLLRRPKNNPDEKGSDPFWEFGSFGCTGCHKTNLMCPKNAHELNGKRFAFAQGGNQGFRLVFLSPPIDNIVNHGDLIEAKWTPINMPFKYIRAPLFIDNHGKTDILSLKADLKCVNRPTWESKFSSAFRSRCKPVSEKIAREIIETYDEFSGKQGLSANSYVEALPTPPLLVDNNRRKTYLALIKTSKANNRCIL